MMPRLVRPSPSKQWERLSPQFRELSDALEAQRAAVSDAGVGGTDPELIVVFDLAGSVENFRNAVARVDGLEFLTEYLDESTEPDDDFYLSDLQKGRLGSTITHSLYVVMSNSTAITQLVRLFGLWKLDPEMKFDHGLTKFRSVFEQLKSIRRWGPSDRVRDTGLLEKWRETVEVAGGFYSPVLVEVELWFRSSSDDRATAEGNLRRTLAAANGVILDKAEIVEIAYHALLVQLPIQEVESVMRSGATSIRLLNADEIMFVSPYAPMSVSSAAAELITDEEAQTHHGAATSDLPRVALLDGLPFVQHERLRGRLAIDDPNGLGENYPVNSRHHGTNMASLIIHGDISDKTQEPMTRPLYVRPILQPHEYYPDSEHVVSNRLFTDLLHSAIRRMIQGEAGRAPTAPSIRIVNLSIGSESRALVRRISPVGRLLDWLAVEYNLLFIVSAGNHLSLPVTIPTSAAGDSKMARIEALKYAHSTSRLRGILPPGDALNALTVGAIHADGAGEINLPDTVWDLVEPGSTALYGAAGPGVGRSIKPELHHSGGRALYIRPIQSEGGADSVELALARTSQIGPGTLAATPHSSGATNLLGFSHGTSNATALVTREADRLFDLLENGSDDRNDFPFPDPSFHPVLAKALLVHSASWGAEGRRLQRDLRLESRTARKELTALLGYGKLDPERLASAATNRAVLVAGGRIGRDQRHTHHVPLPLSLRSKAEWHRFTVTLATMMPTVGHLTKYRAAKVFFESIDKRDTGGERLEAEHLAVRRGTCQHEIFDGARALTFAENGTLPINIECLDYALRLGKNETIRYALVVSVETSVTTSQTVHDEIRSSLQVRARAQTRERLRSR
jgi:hypothetical protein